MEISPGESERVVQRRRKRKLRLLALLAIGLLTFGAASFFLYIALRPVTLRVAVGPPGGEDQKLIEVLGDYFKRTSASVRLSTDLKNGPPESIASLASSNSELAVVRGDLDLPSDFRSIGILRKNVVVLWSPSRERRNSPHGRISSIHDLANHRVGVIGRSAANVTVLRVILQESGVNPDKVSVTQFDANEIGKLASDDTIDAVMTVEPEDSKITVEALSATGKKGDQKFLPVDVSEAIAQRHPRYESEEIPGSAFSASPPLPDDKLETVSINHLLVSRSSLSETVASGLIRQLLDARQELKQASPIAGHIEKPDTDKDAALPAHPGAAAYIDGTERTFMEKYSDYIWAGILLLSGLGSAGAWWRHYRTRDEKELHKVHRDRILSALSTVRIAQSKEELDAMQNQVDDILSETLECFDDGAIEGEDLSAIGLVLEQFHHAVADRRWQLGVTASSH
ncbi:MAG: TRAP transporter substrate-binding protein [Bradyrhizobiaceae bacterium]|nr:MAG: TRAP transporter substrate-binding protein [Bradyrhizobiaceae bacterium]